MATNPQANTELNNQGGQQRMHGDFLQDSPGVGRGITPLIEEHMPLRANINQQINTTEIQIVENPMDDSSEKREEATKTDNETFQTADDKSAIAFSSQKSKDNEFAIAQNYQTADSADGEKQEFMNLNSVADNSQNSSHRNSVEKPHEYDPLNNQFVEENTFNNSQEQASQVAKFNQNAFVEENESQGPTSVEHRGNKSLSLIEEAENEDSISQHMSSVMSGHKNERSEYGHGREGSGVHAYRSSKMSSLEYNTLGDGAIS